MISGGSDGRLGAGEDPGLERRIGVVAAGMVVMFAIFGVRLFQLQVLDGAELRTRSVSNFVRTVRLEAPRGEIVDREGRVLAASRPAFAAQVMPNELQRPELIYRALGQLLERDPNELAALVGKPRGRRRFQVVTLDADLSDDKRAAVESHRFALPGVMTDARPRRLYVEGKLAAHLLGSLGEIVPSQLNSRKFTGYRSGDQVGQSGIESLLERKLRGKNGGRNVVVDVAGREIELIEEVEPQPGGRVVLTLDLDLQREAEAAFVRPPPAEGEPVEPQLMGALVALDPQTGDVLALVSQPAYDPNDFAYKIDNEVWKGLTTDRWRPLQNRPLRGQYAPGSTYKAIVAAAALAEGVVKPEDEFFCPGHYRLGRRVYRCWRRGGHGEVNLMKALAKSCDVYFYQVGIELGIDKLARYARAFGLGQKTGIALPGEKVGIVPTRKWKERERKEVWLKGETVSASIGQGFNLVTPLQLAVAYAAIATGKTVEPRLVLREESWDRRVVEERAAANSRAVPVAFDALEIVRKGLIGVVQGEGGTGRAARVEGVNVAGKTGTTQVVSLSVVEALGEDAVVPVKYRDHAWFAAFAPAEDPQIAIAVLVEHGGGGGSVAAPIAGRVLRHFFEKRAARERGEPWPPQPEAPDGSPKPGVGEPAPRAAPVIEAQRRAVPVPVPGPGLVAPAPRQAG